MPKKHGDIQFLYQNLNKLKKENKIILNKIQKYSSTFEIEFTFFDHIFQQY